MSIDTTDLQRYAKNKKQPIPMTGIELALMRAQANIFIKSGNIAKRQVGESFSMLLDHIDYMTLEMMKSEPVSIETEKVTKSISQETKIRAKRS